MTTQTATKETKIADNRGLRAYLAMYSRRAYEQHGTHQSFWLGKWLRIVLRRSGESIIIGLMRENVYPSQREWQTVIFHMPSWVNWASPEPMQQQTNGGYWLTGTATITQPPLAEQK